MAAPLRIALVGAGSMGSNHARVLAESEGAVLAVIIDTDLDRANALAQRFGTTAAAGLEASMGCDAAIIATATEHHVAVGLALLEAGLPLLIEKPLASALAEVEQIVARSEELHLPLMCGFVERFNPAVTTVLGALDAAPRHIIAQRHSPFSPRVTTSVVWDLLIHDIDLALRVAGEAIPVSVVSQTSVLPPLGIVEIADCSVRFDSGLIGTLSSSRAGQRKMRLLHIATERALYEVDLLRQDVTVYRHISAELVVEQHRPTYRADTTMEIPFVRHGGEPLALQLQHFLDIVAGTADIDGERRSVLPAHRIAAEVAGGQSG